jgi:carbamoyl-phosphate synthase small subunit
VRSAIDAQTSLFHPYAAPPRPGVVDRRTRRVGRTLVVACRRVTGVSFEMRCSSRGFLALEDGTVFSGESVGAAGRATGEAVFTTGMSGYQEVVTDPSFAEQIVCFTAPMIGNYGVKDARSESARVHATAVLMRDARGHAWTDWLRERGVVALSGLDTRSLVLHLRERGAMRAIAVADGTSRSEAVAIVRAQPLMEGRALIAGVSAAEAFVHTSEGSPDVAVIDYGCKRSILHVLARAGARIAVYPHSVDARTLLRHEAIVLSSGPGDPAALPKETAVIGEILGRVPVFGVCLGHQLIALATGGRTFKLRFGHRGANHPVVERHTRRVIVTSQNHGFAVESATGVTHESLYDGTVEGLEFPELRARSLQFHPEAGPGPHDARRMLGAWLEELRDAA